jgi:UTP--glucose-1-phosphate uridylyltransferase
MDKMKHEKLIIDKMKQAELPEILINDFLSKVEKVRTGETGKVQWDTIGDLDPIKDEIDLMELRKSYTPSKDSLSKLVVIKLNGGLGTSMGLEKAKSLIPIKDNRSFLNVVAEQILYMRKKHSVEIPLILMDSYSTQKDSMEEIKKTGLTQRIKSTFLQNKVPRITKSDLEPLNLTDSKEDWCPPGHGDIYLSLKQTGILEELLSSGYEFAFISNGDNLGATIEPYILEYISKHNLEFVMEMTPKTLADTKGGAIYRKMVDGKFQGLELLETAQVPKENEHEFSGMGKFRTFSTNNLWVNLKALAKLLEERIPALSLIVNPKTVSGIDVLQLETAMGSAIGSFQKTKGIIIPRDRFAPVKKCEDYLIRRSDAYTLNEDFSLTMSAERKQSGLSENLVILDEKFYKKIKDFDSLMKVYPSLKLSESLTVVGKIEFDTYIELKGKVSFINKSETIKKISGLNRTSFENEEITL